jgi:3-hydroxy acid dehydrogenase / malonic semialdehyde reductase
VSEQATAVVTGGTGGIGLAVVERLVAHGYAVHALGLPDAHLDALSGRDGVTPVALDVRDAVALRAAVEAADADVLVNNAGSIGALAPAPGYPADTADALIDVNLRAAVHATLAALPPMVARRRGHVVFTGSIAATRPTANTAIYSATKAAIATFADGLRVDLHGSGVRVTVLAPGRVETALYDTALGGHDVAVERLYRDVQSLTPGDVADLVALAVTSPPHVDITRLEVVPTGQAYGGAMITGLPTRE